MLYEHLGPALARYEAWDDHDARDAWPGKLQAFVRLYGFLSQALPFTDRDLEIRYSQHYRPGEHVSFRAEHRYDRAAGARSASRRVDDREVNATLQPSISCAARAVRSANAGAHHVPSAR